MASTQLELLGEKLIWFSLFLQPPSYWFIGNNLGIKANSTGPKSQKCWQVHRHKFRIFWLKPSWWQVFTACFTFSPTVPFIGCGTYPGQQHCLQFWPQISPIIGNIELHIALGYCGHSTPFTIACTMAAIRNISTRTTLVFWSFGIGCLGVFRRKKKRRIKG